MHIGTMIRVDDPTSNIQIEGLLDTDIQLPPFYQISQNLLQEHLQPLIKILWISNNKWLHSSQPVYM